MRVEKINTTDKAAITCNVKIQDQTPYIQEKKGERDSS
jgi:hypothetical protein